MPFRSLVAVACLHLCLVSWIQAAPTLPPHESERFQALFPELYKKLKAQRQIHIAFVGDPLWLDDGFPQSFVQTFLRQLEEAFFYTGGVHDLYEIAHLEEKRPKITYECRPTDVADPGIFQLMQEVSTVGLLNDPDLLVICHGPGDVRAGLDLTTVVRGFDSLHASATKKGAELMVLGPRAFHFGPEASLELRLDTRAQAIAVAQWASSHGVVYHDPNPQLFPRSVLFHPSDDAQSIWNAFLAECVEWVQGQERKAEIASRRQQAVAKDVYARLVSQPPAPRYQLHAEVIGEDAITVSVVGAAKWGGLLVPNLADQRDGVRFQPKLEAAQAERSFQLQFPHDVAQTIRGQLPLSLIVIDDLRVSWIDAIVPIKPLGLEWTDHAHYDNRGKVPVRAKVYRYAGAPDKVPYTIQFGTQQTSGTLHFVGDVPGMIDWVAELPEDSSQRTIRQSLVVELGADGLLGRHERQLDAMRQFPLNTAVPLLAVGGQEAAVNDDDPLAVGGAEASLTLEASEEDLIIHVDLRNFELVSQGGEPSLQADLTLDARSYGQRQTLGYAGVLFISAGPADGPATVSPFTKRAHFGNGYARRPLVLGRQARLSTRPNGDRRLTIQMTRAYFYLHKWDLENFNSQLGIGLSLAIAQPNNAPPLRYVLQETPRIPNNAEDLAVAELSSKGSNRWSLKWSP